MFNEKVRQIFVKYAEDYDLPYPMTIEDDFNAVALWVSENVKNSPPKIQNGTWRIWDVETQEYIDSGVRAQGPKGDTGDTGPQGPTGLTGEQGPRGEQGERGEKGADGITPHITATAEVDESTGNPVVDVTRSGTDTDPVFNFDFSGIKGEKGETGDRGPEGPKGATGDTGPQGPTGLTGEQGPRGEQGEIGPTPDIEMTAAIEPSFISGINANVKVEKTGTPENPKFKFTFGNIIPYVRDYYTAIDPTSQITDMGIAHYIIPKSLLYPTDNPAMNDLVFFSVKDNIYVGYVYGLQDNAVEVAAQQSLLSQYTFTASAKVDSSSGDPSASVNVTQDGFNVDLAFDFHGLVPEASSVHLYRHNIRIYVTAGSSQTFMIDVYNTNPNPYEGLDYLSQDHPDEMFAAYVGDSYTANNAPSTIILGNNSTMATLKYITMSSISGVGVQISTTTITASTFRDDVYQII